jgi:hypothetical protein
MKKKDYNENDLVEYTYEMEQEIQDIIYKYRSVEKRVEILRERGYTVSIKPTSGYKVGSCIIKKKEIRIKIASGVTRNNNAYCVIFKRK